MLLKYEIPKEIRSKPKLIGLGLRELAIMFLGIFMTLTVLGDMVHSSLTIPFYIVVIGTLFWLVMPSNKNPPLKNYMSIYLLFKADKETYYAMDVNKELNKLLIEDEMEGEQ